MTAVGIALYFLFALLSGLWEGLTQPLPSASTPAAAEPKAVEPSAREIPPLPERRPPPPVLEPRPLPQNPVPIISPEIQHPLDLAPAPAPAPRPSADLSAPPTLDDLMNISFSTDANNDLLNWRPDDESPKL
jgi:hypothetical protein